MEAIKNIPLSIVLLAVVALLFAFVPLLLRFLLRKKVGILESEDHKGFRTLFLANLVFICASAWFWYGILTEGFSSLGVISSAVWLVSNLVACVIVSMSVGLSLQICYYTARYRDNPQEFMCGKIR